jgi:PIN domain nuclease of toxin-antitoxin system
MDDAVLLDTCAELPRHHKEPADRFIIASALIRGVPVVTTDRRYKDYGIDTLS